MCDLRSDLRQYFNLNLTNPCVEILSYIFWLDFAVSCVNLSVFLFCKVNCHIFQVQFFSSFDLPLTLEPIACSVTGGNLHFL